MDRRERIFNPEETLRTVFSGLQSRIWTALPGIVQAFYPAKMTVDVQATIMVGIPQSSGPDTPVAIPKLLDCPVLWQGGGGATFTFPIVAGDECLVIFSSRCIDAWWANGGVKIPTELRMHNLSDGFALVGVRSLPNAFAVDTTATTLQSNDGTTYIKLNASGQTLTMTAPNGITLNGVTIDSSGNVNSPATVTASTDVVGGGKHLKTHVHSGVQTGGSNTGAPV